MSVDGFWSFFEETGDIEYYLLYKESSRLNTENDEQREEQSSSAG